MSPNSLTCYLKKILVFLHFFYFLLQFLVSKLFGVGHLEILTHLQSKFFCLFVCFGFFICAMGKDFLNHRPRYGAEFWKKKKGFSFNNKTNFNSVSKMKE